MKQVIFLVMTNLTCLFFLVLEEKILLLHAFNVDHPTCLGPKTKSQCIIDLTNLNFYTPMVKRNIGELIILSYLTNTAPIPGRKVYE
jgi:hypothetical protein